MTLKERVEKNTTLFVLGLLFLGATSGAAFVLFIQSQVGTGKTSTTQTAHPSFQSFSFGTNLVLVSSEGGITSAVSVTAFCDTLRTKEELLETRRINSVHALQQMFGSLISTAYTSYQGDCTIMKDKLTSSAAPPSAVTNIFEIVQNYIRSANALQNACTYFISKIFIEDQELYDKGMLLPLVDFQKELLKKHKSVIEAEGVISSLEGPDLCKFGWNQSTSDKIECYFAKEGMSIVNPKRRLK